MLLKSKAQYWKEQNETEKHNVIKGSNNQRPSTELSESDKASHQHMFNSDRRQSFPNMKPLQKPKSMVREINRFSQQEPIKSTSGKNLGELFNILTNINAGIIKILNHPDYSYTLLL